MMLNAFTALPAARSLLDGAIRRPPLDIFERDNKLHVVLDTPGVSDTDITVTLERGILTITSDRRIGPDPSDRILMQERSYGQRTVRLDIGDHYTSDGATATITNGVLTLTLPAKGELAGHTIPVTASLPAQLAAAT